MMKTLMAMNPTFIKTIAETSVVVAEAFIAYGASVGVAVFAIEGSASLALTAGVNAVAYLGSMITTLATSIGAVGGLAILAICTIVMSSWDRKTLVKEVTEEMFTFLSRHKCILDAKFEALKIF